MHKIEVGLYAKENLILMNWCREMACGYIMTLEITI